MRKIMYCLMIVCIMAMVAGCSLSTNNNGEHVGHEGHEGHEDHQNQ